MWLTVLFELAKGTAAWWLERRPFFGGLQRERLGSFDGVSCTPAITGLRCDCGCAWHEPVPAIYEPSGDVKWDEADPTYSLEATKSSE